MPSIPHLKTCCCCFTTETGTKIIGWLQTILSIIAAVLAVFVLVVSIAHLHKPTEYTLVTNPDGTKSNSTTPTISTGVEDIVFSATTVVIYVLMAILGIYLLVGVHNRNMSYVRIWIIASVTLLCISCAITVIRIIFKIAGKDEGDIISPIISLIISAYFNLVVYSYYRDGKVGTAGTY